MDHSRAFLLVLSGLLLVLSIAFVLPFLQYFLLALLLAYLLTPVQERLETRLRPRFAAALLAFATTIALVVPLIAIIRVTANEALSLLQEFSEGDISLALYEDYIQRLVGIDVDIADSVRSSIQQAGMDEVDSLLGALGTLTHVVIGLGLTLFLLYYFLKSREEFGRWLRETLPLSTDVQDRLFEELDAIMWAVIAGHVFVALIQGVIAGLGLFVTAVPNATFWTVVMILLALLPIVGSFLVWGPAVVYLLAIDRPVAGVFLFIYGTIVVGISDDYLRPILVDRYARLSPSVIIIGVFGGLYVIGFMGVFFGPIVIGMLRAVLDVFREELVQTNRN